MSINYRISNKIKILDCTIRDGGYYNNWNFDIDMVKNYINQCQLQNIDIIELGYIRLANKEYGMFGKINSNLFNALKINNANNDLPALAVMLDAKEMFDLSPDSVVAKIRDLCGEPKICFKYIRLATHYNDLEKCIPYVNALLNVGYELCINLMQIDLANDDEVNNCINYLKNMKDISAIYIADSLGTFLPNKLEKLITTFKENCSQSLGFHAHDNLGLALINSLCALTAGVTWIDSTMYGMGRGAGNVRTEQILALKGSAITNHISHLYEFLITYIQPLKDKYSWGSSALYGMTSINKLHPSYVQKAEEDGYSASNILQALKKLSFKNAHQFSKTLLDETLNYEQA